MADDRNWQDGDLEENDGNRDDYHSRRRSRDIKHKRRSRDRSHSNERHSRKRTKSRSRSRSPSERRSRGRYSRDNRGSSGSEDSGDDYYEYGHRSRSYDNDSRGYRRDERTREEDRQYSGNERITGHDWRSKLTSIRDAHFNRSKQPPVMAQNQFKNDGSFLEMFKKKMSEQVTPVTPNSLVLASSSIQFSPDISLPPLTTMPLEETHFPPPLASDADQDVDGVPMPAHKSLPVPVSVGKRRLAKPLKTGIIVKKPQEPSEDDASQEKLNAWEKYLQEVQQYKSAKCLEDDNTIYQFRIVKVKSMNTTY